MAFKGKEHIKKQMVETSRNMGLFDFIDVMFTRDAFKHIPEDVKNKFFFMSIRRIGIMFPMQAESLSNMYLVSKSVVLDYWNSMFRRNMRKMPPWAYTKQEKAEKKHKSEVTQEMKRFYMRKKMLSEKDYDYCESLYPKEFESEVLAFWYGYHPQVEQMRRIGKATKHQPDRQEGFSLL